MNTSAMSVCKTHGPCFGPAEYQDLALRGKAGADKDNGTGNEVNVILRVDESARDDASDVDPVGGSDMPIHLGDTQPAE